MAALPAKQLGELKVFINLVKQQPNLLHTPDLKFFKDYLDSLGATIPPPAKPTPKQEPEKHDHGHGHSHGHGHDHHTHEHEHKHEPPKAEPKQEEKKPEPAPEPEVPDNDLWSPDTDSHPLGDTNKNPTEEEENEASDLYTQGRKALREKNYESALKLLTEAIQKNPRTAVNYATRGEVFVAMKKPTSAIKDAERCLQINPDSAKGYKIRGTARRHLGLYEEGIRDLYQGNKLDWDETTDALIKSIKERVDKIVERKKKEEHASKERELEERKKKASDQRRHQQEEEDRRRREAEGMGGGMPGGMPGGGMPGGGMGGMPGMEFLNDPEIQKVFQDPALMAQMQECLKDPAKLEQLAQTNPKLKRVIEKLGPLMGMFGRGGGGPGGHGGAPDDDGGDAPAVDDLD